MNKLNPEDLHLLLDEPIYVLHSDHYKNEDQNSIADSEDDAHAPVFEGKNEKGILIFIGKESKDTTEDKTFLFKGLNALDISAVDVAIVKESVSLEAQEKIEHSKCINFSDNTPKEKLYNLTTSNGISLLECHSISQIRSNQDHKRRFWEALQSLFLQ